MHVVSPAVDAAQDERQADEEARCYVWPTSTAPDQRLASEQLRHACKQQQQQQQQQLQQHQQQQHGCLECAARKPQAEKDHTKARARRSRAQSKLADRPPGPRDVHVELSAQSPRRVVWRRLCTRDRHRAARHRVPRRRREPERAQVQRAQDDGREAAERDQRAAGTHQAVNAAPLVNVSTFAERWCVCVSMWSSRTSCALCSSRHRS